MAGHLYELLSASRLQLSDLQTLTFGGCPDKYRAVVWKLLLSYYPLVRDDRPAHVKRLRAQYHEWVSEVADESRHRSSAHDGSRSNATDSAVDDAVDETVADIVAETEAIASPQRKALVPIILLPPPASRDVSLLRTPNVFGSPSIHGSLPGEEARHADLDALFAVGGGIKGGGGGGGVAGRGTLFDDDGILCTGGNSFTISASASTPRRNKSVDDNSDDDDDEAENDDDTDEDHFAEVPSPTLLPPKTQETDHVVVVVGSGGGGETIISPPPPPPPPTNPAWVADAELRREIFKDVERTHAELSFFANSLHTDALSRILLVYAKLNAGVGYIQGMNELLAPLLYVCVGDAVGLRDGVGGASGAAAEKENEEFYGALFAAEADAFFLFASLMAEHRDVFIQAQDNSSSGIRGQLDRFARILARREPIISARLSAHHIPPDFYAMRWLTALASREFTFPDTLMLWDSLFADPERFAFLRQVCVAIVRTQKEILLTADFATTVKLLQRPPCIDFIALLSTAMQVRAEENNERAVALARRAPSRQSSWIVSKGGGGGGGRGGDSAPSRERSWAGSPLSSSSSSTGASNASQGIGSGSSEQQQQQTVSPTAAGGDSGSPRTDAAWLSMNSVSRGFSVAWGNILRRKQTLLPEGEK
jgi:hypothetical protein